MAIKLETTYWLKGWWLFAAQATAHLSIPLMIYHSNWQHYLLSAVVYFFTGCFGMSMTYHRLLSHKSWLAPSWFYFCGSVFGTLGLTGSPLAWAAIHRDHHRLADTANDPHSPLYQSFFSVQFLSMFHKPNLLAVRDLTKKKWLRFLHRYYFMINLLYVALLFYVDPFAVIYLYLFPAALLWNAGSLINNFGHISGYRNFRTRDNSRNNLLLGLIMWGEGWHNNHHKNPVSARFGMKYYEIDISWQFIKLFRKKTKRLRTRISSYHHL